MRRVIAVMFVVIGGFAQQASAQSAKTMLGVGWTGTQSSSTHDDEMEITVAQAFYGAGHLDVSPFGARRTVRQAVPSPRTLSWVGQFRIGHESGGGVITEFLAGIRITNETLLKWPCYIQITGGAMHFSGSTNAVVHPSVGVMFPMAGGKRWFYIQGGVPLILFSGNTEVGREASAGLSFAVGK